MFSIKIFLGLLLAICVSATPQFVENPSDLIGGNVNPFPFDVEHFTDLNNWTPATTDGDATTERITIGTTGVYFNEVDYPGSSSHAYTVPFTSQNSFEGSPTTPNSGTGLQGLTNYALANYDPDTNDYGVFSFDTAVQNFGVSVRATRTAVQFQLCISGGTIGAEVCGDATAPIDTTPNGASQFLGVSTTGGETFDKVAVKIAAGIEGGAWIVYDDLFWGPVRINCANTQQNPAVMRVDLTTLPATVDISVEGQGVQGDPFFAGVSVTIGGGQEIQICVPANQHIVTVSENGVEYVTPQDHQVDCSSNTCLFNPQELLDIGLGCNELPLLDGQHAIITFQFRNGNTWTPFRGPLNIEDIIATDGKVCVITGNDYRVIFSVVDNNNAVLANINLEYWHCDETDNWALAPEKTECEAKEDARGATLTTQLRVNLGCNCEANNVQSDLPTGTSLSIEFQGNSDIKWQQDDVGGQCLDICVLALGDYTLTANDNGSINSASGACSPLDNQCNTGVIDLVSILTVEQRCPDVVDECGNPVSACGTNNHYARQNPLEGYTLTLHDFRKEVDFRDGIAINGCDLPKVCVLSIPRVDVSLVREGVNEIENSYNCQSGQDSPSDCTEIGDHDDFFAALKIDASNLPSNINTQISWWNGQAATLLYANPFCNVGGEVNYYCVPALGSDVVPNEPCKDPNPRLPGAEVYAEECSDDGICGGGTRKRQSPVNVDKDNCIAKRIIDIDCRSQQCCATLAQELCIWELNDLPKDTQVELLSPSNQEPVRTMNREGRRPRQYGVLCADLQVRITENPGIGDDAPCVTSDKLDCSEGCSYNDFLSVLDVDSPTSVGKRQVLDHIGVDLALTGATVPFRKVRVLAGKKNRYRNQVFVLRASPAKTYCATYNWGGTCNPWNRNGIKDGEVSTRGEGFGYDACKAPECESEFQKQICEISCSTKFCDKIAPVWTRFLVREDTCTLNSKWQVSIDGVGWLFPGGSKGYKGKSKNVKDEYYYALGGNPTQGNDYVLRVDSKCATATYDLNCVCDGPDETCPDVIQDRYCTFANPNNDCDSPHASANFAGRQVCLDPTATLSINLTELGDIPVATYKNYGENASQGSAFIVDVECCEQGKRTLLKQRYYQGNAFYLDVPQNSGNFPLNQILSVCVLDNESYNVKLTERLRDANLNVDSKIVRDECGRILVSETTKAIDKCRPTCETCVECTQGGSVNDCSVASRVLTNYFDVENTPASFDAGTLRFKKDGMDSERSLARPDVDPSTSQRYHAVCGKFYSQLASNTGVPGGTSTQDVNCEDNTTDNLTCTPASVPYAETP